MFLLRNRGWRLDDGPQQAVNSLDETGVDVEGAVEDGVV